MELESITGTKGKKLCKNDCKAYFLEPTSCLVFQLIRHVWGFKMYHSSAAAMLCDREKNGSLEFMRNCSEQKPHCFRLTEEM